MDVFLYIRSAMRYGVDEVEDVLEAALDGTGEVTGSGTGASGSNFDIEVYDNAVDQVKIVELIRNALTRFDLPRSAVIVVGGIQYPLAQ